MTPCVTVILVLAVCIVYIVLFNLWVSFYSLRLLYMACYYFSVLLFLSYVWCTTIRTCIVSALLMLSRCSTNWFFVSYFLKLRRMTSRNVAPMTRSGVIGFFGEGGSTDRDSK